MNIPGPSTASSTRSGSTAGRIPARSRGEIDLAAVLDTLLDDAHARGVLAEDSVVYRDLMDSELMGRLTPRPAQVIEKFNALYEKSPEAATDWYYAFSQDTNYIRRDRIAKDVQWKTDTEYGELDITINLSKPEKDPKAIAAARNLPASNYPALPALRRERGLRRARKPPRAAEPQDYPHHDCGQALVLPVLALRLLQRALHLPQPRAHADEDRPRMLREAAGLRPAVPALLRGLERGFADCRRQHPRARPLPGRGATPSPWSARG